MERIPVLPLPWSIEKHGVSLDSALEWQDFCEAWCRGLCHNALWDTNWKIQAIFTRDTLG